MTPKEQLSFVVNNANDQVRRIQTLMKNVGNNPAALSISDKYEIKELFQKFLLNANSISNIIEKDQSLMLSQVPGFEGPIPAIAWMGWSMQWIESFERTMKPILDKLSVQSSPARPTSSYQPYRTAPARQSTNYQQYRPAAKQSEGCYIATMAYGDYDHPQVKILRRFRDDVLLKSNGGRLFVNFYYWVSPKMVRVLSGHDAINQCIRRILDRMVEIVK